MEYMSLYNDTLCNIYLFFGKCGWDKYYAWKRTEMHTKFQSENL